MATALRPYWQTDADAINPYILRWQTHDSANAVAMATTATTTKRLSAKSRPPPWLGSWSYAPTKTGWQFLAVSPSLRRPMAPASECHVGVCRRHGVDSALVSFPAPTRSAPKMGSTHG